MFNFKFENFTLGKHFEKIDVICLHGLGCSKENFFSIIEGCNKLNINCISIDLPGFGENICDKINIKTYNHFFEQLSSKLKFSDGLIIILHSISSCFMNEINKHLNYKKIIFLEGNLTIHDAGWSKAIIKMGLKKNYVYSNFVRSNYFKIITNSMLTNLKETKIKKYFKNGNKFKNNSFYTLAKIGYERTTSSEIAQFLIEDKKKFLYIIGSREVMKKTLNFLINSSIEYMTLDNCGHYPMIEKPGKIIDVIKKLHSN